MVSENYDMLKLKSRRQAAGSSPIQSRNKDRTERELWRSFVEGNEKAYETIYKEFSPQLYSYGMNICRDKELVEDCLHDLFIYIYQHRDGLGYTDSIKFYLFRSLKRKIALSSNLKEKQMSACDTAHIQKVQTSYLLENQLETRESISKRKTLIFRALNQLSCRQKEIIHLLYYNNLSHREISQVMNIEVRTVYNQVHNAITSLKNSLKKSAFF